MRTLTRSLVALIGAVGLLSAQSPADQASATIAGKSITIKYSAPSVRGRQIFGDGGVVSRDSTYPVWRAGANAATMLQTGADLDIAGLNVPAGTYTLYVLVKDPEKWKLIINKQTGQNGDSYDPSMDLGRVDMKMEKPPVAIEKLKYTITVQQIGFCRVYKKGDRTRQLPLSPSGIRLISPIAQQIPLDVSSNRSDDCDSRNPVTGRGAFRRPQKRRSWRTPDLCCANRNDTLRDCGS